MSPLLNLVMKLGLASVTTLAIACSDRSFHKVDWIKADGVWGDRGESCFLANELDGRASQFTPVDDGSDYGDFIASGGGAIVFIAHSRGEVLAERRYDEAFIESRKVDEFVVTTKGGVERRMAFWGGAGCQ